MASDGGVRATKKRETRRALTREALRLADERGLHGFTVEEVARSAGVSTRTFFNYFASKEAAVTGVDPDELLAACFALEQRPDTEDALEALAAIILPEDGPALTEEVEADAIRQRVLARHPELLPHRLAAQQQIESALSSALARRLNASLADPYPSIAVAALCAALRAMAAWYAETRPPEPIRHHLDAATDMVRRGLGVRT